MAEGLWLHVISMYITFFKHHLYENVVAYMKMQMPLLYITSLGNQKISNIKMKDEQMNECVVNTIKWYYTITFIY